MRLSEREIIQMYYRKPEQFWLDLRKKNLIDTYYKAIREVEAYTDFLKGQGFESTTIKEQVDFESLPAVNKKNYFHKNSFAQTTKKNSLSLQKLVLTSTSGSTGEPTYFPRTENLDWQYSILAEMFIQNGPESPVLFIDCFGMGVWIGGLITYQAFRNAALRGYPVSIITPGVNKKEIFHTLVKMAPSFNNIIIAGYPPFIKDVIDEAPKEGVNFKNFKTRLLFAAEGYTENFRDYLAKAVGIKDVYHDTLNIYGSAELGAMAFETPTSILIKRLTLKYPKAYFNLFKTDKNATLAQYNPMFVNFEQQDGKVLITADGPTPFVRYQIGDNGGIFTIDQIASELKAEGVDLHKEAAAAKVKLMNLPLVYIYERSDFSTKLYGAIIYPEPIRDALQESKFDRYLTGKFVILTKFDEEENEFLEVNIELKPEVQAAKKLEQLCEEAVLKHLLKKNAEYKNNYDSIPQKVRPRIVLRTNGDPAHFPAGAKQKWVTK